LKHDWYLLTSTSSALDIRIVNLCEKIAKQRDIIRHLGQTIDNIKGKEYGKKHHVVVSLSRGRSLTTF